MRQKIFTFALGTLLLVPILMAVFSDCLLLAAAAVLYGFILWLTSKKLFRKFWRSYWKITMEINRILEVR